MVTLAGCAESAYYNDRTGFCIEGPRCFFPEDDLKPLLDVAQPSDKCDKKTGKGKYAVPMSTFVCLC